MEEIKEILNKEFTFKELFTCLDLIRKNGDIVVIKFDEQRTDTYYTLFITFSEEKNKSMIRIDDKDLQDGIIKLLNLYLEGAS